MENLFVTQILQNSYHTCSKKSNFFLLKVFKFCDVIPQISSWKPRENKVEVQLCLESGVKNWDEMVMELRKGVPFVEAYFEPFFDDDSKLLEKYWALDIYLMAKSLPVSFSLAFQTFPKTPQPITLIN